MKPQRARRSKLDTAFLVEGLRTIVAESAGQGVDVDAFVKHFDAYRKDNFTLMASAFAALLTMNSKALQELRDRLELLEQRSTSYRGVHEAHLTYAKHDMVTRSGGLWLAQCQTKETPGAGSSDWKLVVKRGRSG